MTFAEDTHWITAFRQGDVQAFGKVYDAYYQQLHYFAFTLTSDKTKAYDIVQESFLQIWNKRAGFDNIKHIRSYLFLAARHLAIDLARADKLHHTVHEQILHHTRTSTEANADRAMIDAEIMAEIHEQIKQLPAQCGQIFKMIFFEQKGTAEIAVQLNLSPQTVLNQKAIALRQLRSILIKKELWQVLVSFLSI